jgi:hypothetical protein
MVQAVSRRFVTAEAKVYPRSDHVWFPVNVAKRHLNPSTLGFPLSIILLLHQIYSSMTDVM